MKVFAITQTEDPVESVKLLKSQANYQGQESAETGDLSKQIKKYLSQYNPAKHVIFDTDQYPDRIIQDNDGNPTKQCINRIGLPLQKVIVRKGASFLFGLPVSLDCQTDKDKKLEQVLDAIKKIWKDNKLDSINRQLARNLGATTQVAECWYPVVAEKHDRYGFDSTIRMRMQVFSPMKGDYLYPYFDEFGDMIAFCRQFNRTVLVAGKAKAIPHFEVYTDEETVMYQEIDGKWQKATLGQDKAGQDIQARPNTLTKIPIVFAQQDAVDWEDVQTIIERLEYMMSKFADTVDYHASPKLIVKGEIKNFAKKGEVNQTFELEGEGADMKYLSWDHATDSVKLEIDTLLRFVYSFAQTPDLSFDSVKGLPAVSGIALKMLLVDAHLKVQDKREIFDAYLERRLRLLAGYIGVMNKDLNDAAKLISITPVINPFEINDLSQLITDLTNANGGKPVASLRTAVAKVGLVEDVDQEVKQIQEEERQSRQVNLTESTVI